MACLVQLAQFTFFKLDNQFFATRAGCMEHRYIWTIVGQKRRRGRRGLNVSATFAQRHTLCPRSKL
jgi:hypothetical protein